MESARLNLLGLTQKQLGELLQELGEKPYRAQQVMKWLHHRYLDDVHEMSDVSKKLRQYFADHCEVREPEIITEKVSVDGTRKWLLRSLSGSAVEMVFIPEDGRGTLCVSSQVGCALVFQFVSAGGGGLIPVSTQ